MKNNRYDIDNVEPVFLQNTCEDEVVIHFHLDRKLRIVISTSSAVRVYVCTLHNAFCGFFYRLACKPIFQVVAFFLFSKAMIGLCPSPHINGDVRCRNS